MHAKSPSCAPHPMHARVQLRLSSVPVRRNLEGMRSIGRDPFCPRRRLCILGLGSAMELALSKKRRAVVSRSVNGEHANETPDIKTSSWRPPCWFRQAPVDVDCARLATGRVPHLGTRVKEVTNSHPGRNKQPQPIGQCQDLPVPSWLSRWSGGREKVTGSRPPRGRVKVPGQRLTHMNGGAKQYRRPYICQLGKSLNVWDPRRGLRLRQLRLSRHTRRLRGTIGGGIFAETSIVDAAVRSHIAWHSRGHKGRERMKSGTRQPRMTRRQSWRDTVECGAHE
jgi:hypothetical protein